MDACMHKYARILNRYPFAYEHIHNSTRPPLPPPKKTHARTHLHRHHVGEAEVEVGRGLVVGHLPRDVVHAPAVEPVAVVGGGWEGCGLGGLGAWCLGLGG